ncbi:MAG TPA: Rrf2 family transcriptional regulator [Desulfobacteria bacterium]|nr:Rrf2 family transcriptional regulator [Desulfobacteria bacterium]
MNINQATDYAFRAVLFLAGQPPGKVVEAQQISRQEVIPMRFLLKIMPSLIKAGVVRSQRGVGGGYMLAKTPSEINFLDIVEAIEGPIHINRCLEDYSYCSKKGAPECQVHRALADIQQKLVSDLKSHKIGDILRK